MGKTPAEKIRVMIVDDHAVVREGLKNYLRALHGFEVAGEAGSGAEALEVASRVKPQVVLMDLMMPGMDGIECTRRLHDAQPDVKVIVLTSFADEKTVLPALKAGASAYLLKDVGPRDLSDAIMAAARGETRLHPDVTQKLVAGIKAADGPSPEEALTAREMEVLKSLAGGKSNKEIAAELFISEKTVKTHMGSILDKLGLQDRTQAALYAAKRGIG